MKTNVLSTDKAVYPINAMGISKAMMEKIVVAKSRFVDPENTTICCTRYGNVMLTLMRHPFPTDHLLHGQQDDLQIKRQ